MPVTSNQGTTCLSPRRPLPDHSYLLALVYAVALYGLAACAARTCAVKPVRSLVIAPAAASPASVSPADPVVVAQDPCFLTNRGIACGPAAGVPTRLP